MKKKKLKIEFFEAIPGLDFPLKSFLPFIEQVCRQEKIPVAQVRIIGVTDDYLRTLHQKFLHDDSYSDVMVFPLDEGKDKEAEIYISLDRVKANAKTYRVPVQEEIARLISHALLHLQGFDDQTPTDRRKMRVEENRILKKYWIPFLLSK